MTTTQEISKFLDCSHPNLGAAIITGPTQLIPGESGGLGFWTEKFHTDLATVLGQTTATAILVPNDCQLSSQSVVLLPVEDPRTAFMQVLQEFFAPIQPTGIHPSAVVEATEIGDDVYIGPNAYVAAGVKIGDGTVIHANVSLLSNVTVGKNTIIGPNTVIGFTGFGYGRQADGSPIAFPHYGGVVIGDRVEIGSNTSIDRGTLGNTIIKDDAKIDNLVHVAHNCVIHEGAFVIASSVLCGGVQVGRNSWVAPNAAILEQVSIGENSLVALSATVLKDVEDNDVVAGTPAKSIRRKEN
jgi:UDP-3-O-[3-hydroxymyristoyl] glucosamine N-acyltransferase